MRRRIAQLILAWIIAVAIAAALWLAGGLLFGLATDAVYFWRALPWIAVLVGTALTSAVYTLLRGRWP